MCRRAIRRPHCSAQQLSTRPISSRSRELRRTARGARSASNAPDPGRGPPLSIRPSHDSNARSRRLTDPPPRKSRPEERMASLEPEPRAGGAAWRALQDGHRFLPRVRADIQVEAVELRAESDAQPAVDYGDAAAPCTAVLRPTRLWAVHRLVLCLVRGCGEVCA